MPLQTPETLLLTFFSCSQTTLSFPLLLLFAPLFAHHVSDGDLFSAHHRRLDTLLPCHQDALFACSWPTHWFWWSSSTSLPASALGCPAFALLLGCLLQPSQEHRHLHRHCAGQPLAFSPLGISHLRLLPSPSSALVILVLVFNPEAHLVPGCIGLLFVQISDHHQFLFIALFPTDQHGSFHTLPMFTPFSLSTPSTTTPLHPLPHRTEGLFSR